MLKYQAASVKMMNAAHDRIQSIHESEAKLVETAVDKAWAARSEASWH